jgi:hypothetical protein
MPVAEPQPTGSRRSRQLRQEAVPAAHNNEEGEFSANQPVIGAVGAVRSISVNPRLQMHSLFLYFFIIY